MDYGDGTMTQAVNIERIFNEFFHNVKATLRRCCLSSLPVRACSMLT